MRDELANLNHCVVPFQAALICAGTADAILPNLLLTAGQILVGRDTKSRGLCGNYDGDDRDDLYGNNGHDELTSFIDSWKIDR